MTRGAALRAADRAQPQARARRALDPRPAARPVLARADPDGRRSPGAASRSTSRAASRSSATPSRTRPTRRSDRRSRPPGWRRIATSDYVAAYAPLLSAGRLWPRGGRARSCSARSALRLWGFRHGLPLVYNADENAHFVAGAIGMFGHTYNPNYFINPPAFTYLLHVAFALGFGGRDGRLGVLRGRPRRRLRASRGRCRRVLGAVAVGLLAWAGARLFDRRDRLRRRRAAGGRVPARPLRAPRAQRRADAGAAVPRAGRRRRRLRARADARLRARRRRPRAGVRDQVHRRDRAAAAAGGRAGRRRTSGPRRRLGGLALARRARARRLPRRQPVRAAGLRRVPRRPAASSRPPSSDGGGKLGLDREQRDPLLPRDDHLGARLGAGAGRARRRGGAGGARLAARARARARRSSCSCSSWARRTASSPAGCCRSSRCCACSPPTAR